MMNVSKMADSVFAAFLSAFFSCVFFFFLPWFLVAFASNAFPAKCLGIPKNIHHHICVHTRMKLIPFALSGILTSGMADGLLFTWFEKTVEFACNLFKLLKLCSALSSGIILIDGWSPWWLSFGSPGNLITIVYTLSEDPDLPVIRFDVGNVRVSRGV